MKLIIILSLILLNCMIIYVATKENNSGINLNAIFAGNKYKKFGPTQEWYQNSFFKKCDLKTGKYDEKKKEISFKCENAGGDKKEFKAKMDQCLGNPSGKLAMGYNFHKTTKDCKVHKRWFKCKAQDGNKKWHPTKFNLNYVMYFMKEKLTCSRKKPWIKKP